MHRSPYLFLAFAALFFLLLAFQEPITRQQLIKEKIDGYVNNYRKTQEEKCRNEILERAGFIVDSLLIDRARSEKDTISKPPRPIKPDTPDRKRPKDSTAVAPLFRDSIN